MTEYSHIEKFYSKESFPDAAKMDLKSGNIQQVIRKRTELFTDADVEKFGECGSDEERFGIVLGQLSTRRDLIRLSEYPEEIKLLDRAMEFKKKGNEAFQSAQWLNALKLYSLSYIRCPQDKSKSYFSRISFKL